MNFIQKLFSNPNQQLTDYSILTTDLHSHLVPAIDDGSASLEESLDLIKGLHELGYKKLITTPHIQADLYQNTPEIILKGLDSLKKAIKENQIPIEIYAAAEYHIDYLICNRNKLDHLLTFGNNYLLFELPFFNRPLDFESILFDLQISKYKLILAHPERYTYFHYSFDDYVRLKDRGILFQMNISSLIGHYTKPVKAMAEKLIKNGMIDIVGTDIHHTQQLSLLHKTLENKDLIQLINSGKLLNNRLL